MRKGKIVIAEDNQELSLLLAERLREEGYDVHRAKDGQRGFLKVQAERPDLLIVDLAMPKLSGNRVVRMLREDLSCCDIPIIMLSAFVTPDMVGNVEVPADCYMTKPFNEESLISKIDELISRRRGQSVLV